MGEKDDKRLSLADLCNEAVIAHGADWPAIKAFIAKRLESMDAEVRASLIRDVQLMLAADAERRASN